MGPVKLAERFFKGQKSIGEGDIRVNEAFKC